MESKNVEFNNNNNNANLERATNIYEELQPDIQKMLAEGNRLISLFHELIDSEECRHLKYECLIDPVTKIIQNEYALAEMRKLNTIGFDISYKQHFIEKKNTFTLVDDPYTSMCMEFVMRRWH
jgi:hypothetical protein